MTDEEIERLVHMNQTLLYLLGYATSFAMSLKDSPYNDSRDDEKINWFIKSVENLVYLDKPLSPRP